MADVNSQIARRRVPLGFVCAAAVVWLARPTLRSLAAGSAIAIVGEALRVWAAGHVEKGREVTRSGPYRLMRHPLYVGSAIIGAGVSIAAARVSVAVLLAAYLTITIGAAIRHEEANMRASFGDQYSAYLESRAGAVRRPFSFGRARKNQEHRTIAGLVIVGAIFAAKAVFGSR
jgi:protein-S-isoprenylcysteine O-methyltransferase Ste14